MSGDLVARVLGVEADSTGDARLDAVVQGRPLRILRVPPFDEESSGAWIVEPKG